MLVEDPVFSGDKEKTFLIPFPLKTGFPPRYNKYPETSIQYLYATSYIGVLPP
jgi:hypothetical protein